MEKNIKLLTPAAAYGGGKGWTWSKHHGRQISKIYEN